MQERFWNWIETFCSSPKSFGIAESANPKFALKVMTNLFFSYSQPTSEKFRRHDWLHFIISDKYFQSFLWSDQIHFSNTHIQRWKNIFFGSYRSRNSSPESNCILLSFCVFKFFYSRFFRFNIFKLFFNIFQILLRLLRHKKCLNFKFGHPSRKLPRSTSTDIKLGISIKRSSSALILFSKSSDLLQGSLRLQSRILTHLIEWLINA